jgi:aspartate/methionine/tyrosine aminotransferase
MKLNPLAEELNTVLAREARPVLEMLSPIGRRYYFPKGILSQSAEAKVKAHRFNATIGIATEGGTAMHLPSIHKHFQGVPPKDLYTYAPVSGRPDLRERWKAKQLEENPRMRGKSLGLPVVTSALTHGLSLISELFIEPGDPIIIPDQLWGNYRLTFEVRQGGVIETFPLFDGDRFNRAGFASAVRTAAGQSRKITAILNFPNNPTGFTPTPGDAEAIAAALVAAAEHGALVLAIVDDAYFGLFYEGDCLQESIFGYLAGAHPRLLAVKLDGATKEEFVWGFRLGFLTYGAGGSGKLDDVHAALEKKTCGAIRAGISNSPHHSQSIVLSALLSPEFKGEQAAKRDVLRRRALKVKEVLRKPEYAEMWTQYPFNSGYFMCLRLHDIEAEKLRAHLLDRHGVGTIATAKHDLRIAFSCLEVEQIPEVFDTIYRGALELKEK